MMNKIPAKVLSYNYTAVSWLCSAAQVLLKILHLFAGFFDLRFHSQAQISNSLTVPAHPAGLGKQGVGLAIHLLQQKIELLAHLAVGLQQRMKMLDVGAETGDLFFHITALGEH